MKQLRMTLPAAVFTAAMISHPMLQAGVLVLENFNYGAGAANGVTASGTGLTGQWAVSNTGVASSSFTTSGLTFGANYATSAGALVTNSNYSGSNSVSSATVRLNASTTGTLWNSYLINWSSIGASGSGSTVAGIAASSDPVDSSIALRSQMYSNATIADRKIGAGFDGTSTSSANTALVTGTTYMYVSKYTNVGTTLSAGTPGTATTWILTLDQYNALHTADNLTEDGLNALNAVTRRVTDGAVTTGSFAFDTSGYLTLKADAPNFNGHQINATWDEIKYGTEIGDVIGVVPEPSSVALLGLAAGVLGVRRRRERA